MPAVTTKEAVEAWENYQDLAQKIEKPEDIQWIEQKGQKRKFRKKSFWRKMERFFNVSLELREERKETREKELIYYFTFRATAPNGAFVDSTGSCSNMEKGYMNTEHNTRATAETRAKNRAISDLVAFGEVTAEEIVGEYTTHTDTSVEEDLGLEPVSGDSNAKPPEKKKSGNVISESQAKMLFAKCKAKGLTNADIHSMIKPYGYEKTFDIDKSDFDKILAKLE